MKEKLFKILVELPHLVFMPNDLLEGLTLAVAYDKCEPCHASAKDLEVYKLYDTDDNAFLGTCFVLKVGEDFYSNIQGTPQIICFSKDTFKMVKSNELWIPLETKEEDVTFLVCKFEQLCDGYNIYPMSIKKAIKPLLNETTDIHVFDKKFSVMDALEFYEKNFFEK